MTSRTVLLITNAPTPYRIPLFNELHRQLMNRDLKLVVLFGVAGYSRRRWNIDLQDCRFEYSILDSRHLPFSARENPVFTYSGILRAYRRHRPVAVITNEFSLATMKLWMMDFFASVPYIIWSGGIESRGRVLSLPRRIQRRLLIHRARAFIAYGTRARELLVRLGAAPEKVFIAINTVDTDFFRNAAERLRANREKTGTLRLLYVGHITRGKRLDQLFDALARVGGQEKAWQLDIVGAGEEEEALRERSRDLGLDSRIRFHGYQQRDEIPRFMVAADCFVFPSEYDVWGLVLVEAMASSLPCLASIHSGATEDLIVDGDTGFAADFSDTDGISARIAWMIAHRDQLRRMGEAACEFIEAHVTLEVSARGMVDALGSVTDAREQRPAGTA